MDHFCNNKVHKLYRDDMYKKRKMTDPESEQYIGQKQIFRCL